MVRDGEEVTELAQVEVSAQIEVTGLPGRAGTVPPRARLVLDAQVIAPACLIADGQDRPRKLRERHDDYCADRADRRGEVDHEGRQHAAGGFWAEELINPYQILTAAGTDVALATPNGVAAPLQEYSLDESMTGSAARTAEVDPDTIDAVFVPGGTGPMEDMYDDRDLGRILVALQARTAPVATVCHGTIGLLSARPGGTWIFGRIPDDRVHRRGRIPGRPR